MIKNLMTAVFGTRFDRERRRIQPTVDAIHAEEDKLKDLSEDELKAQTAQRLGHEATLEDVFMTYTGRSLDDDVEEDESGDDE